MIRSFPLASPVAIGMDDVPTGGATGKTPRERGVKRDVLVDGRTMPGLIQAVEGVTGGFQVVLLANEQGPRHG
jgi:hypothetical protein